MRRTLTTLITTIGLLMTGLAAPLLLAPAGASTPAPEAVSAGQSQSAPVSQRAKPKRDLHDAIVKKRGKLYFQGRVDPGHGPVIVQKKDCPAKRCKWHKFKTVTTHGPKERWSVRVFAPRRGNWYWRGYVKAYGGYATSWTGKWKTYTI